jgi:inorganic triphosphatase YgiF
MSVPREVELKIYLDSPSLKALRHGLTSMAPEDVARERLTSVYFDTKKLSLHRKGLSLRIRRQAERRIQTLKGGKEGGGGLFDRLEWNADVAGDSPDLSGICETPFWPVLDAGRLSSRLRPVFTTEVDRTVWRVRSGGADVEVALDEGRVSAGDKMLPFAELEIELKSGSRSELFNVARSLLPSGRLKPGVLAKSERGYALLMTEQPASFKAEALFVEPNVSIEEAFKAIVRGCIRHFRMNEALLIETRGPEPLHQCRIALRRLRTALSLFKDVIADEEVEKLKARLRSLTQKLGVARDLDVYLGKLEGAAITSETDEVVERVRKDREHAYDRVIARSEGLIFDILAWSEAGLWLSSLDKEIQARREEPIDSFAADVLARRTRKIRKRGRHLAELRLCAERHVLSPLLLRAPTFNQ